MTSGKRDVNDRGWVAECAGWVLVVAGILLAITAGRETASLFAGESSWAQAEATVVRTQVSPWKQHSLASFGSPKAGFQVRQELVYFRKGHRYQESVLLGVYGSEREAQLVLENATRPGRTRQIWVDAANPAQVRLEPTARRMGWTRGLLAMLGLASKQEEGATDEVQAPGASLQPVKRVAFASAAPRT